MKKAAGLMMGIILSTSVLTGCADKNKNIPELLEPVALNDAYREVKRGDVGIPKMFMSKVTSMEYGQTFPTNDVDETINVNVGDKVKKGDIVAYADIKATREESEALAHQIEVLEQQKAIDDDIYKIRLSALKESGADEKETGILKENKRYTDKVFEDSLSELKKQKEELQKIINDGTLRANCDGYVSYVKNLLPDNRAGSTENIILIMNKNEKFFELDTVKINQFKELGASQSIYTYIDGKKCELKELAYTSEELAFAKFSGNYPLVRLTCDGVNNIPEGDNFIIYFETNVVKDVLVVGKDSVFSDETEYVYVLEDGKKIRRNVKVGNRDKYNVEITEGLYEGEQVYYSSEAVLPVDYLEYNVMREELVIPNYSKTYECANAQGIYVKNKYAGTVIDVSDKLKPGGDIKKGDYLYSIKAVVGMADIAKARLELDRARSEYKTAVEQFDSEIEELKKNSADKELQSEILLIEKEKEKAVLYHNEVIAELEKTYDKLSAGNDNGVIKIFSEYDGKIGSSEIIMDMKVKEGFDAYTVILPESNLICVTMSKIEADTIKQNVYDCADIDEKVVVTIGENMYTGTCIGRVQYNKDFYLTSNDKGAVITENGPTGFDEMTFWVKMDDPAFYELVSRGLLEFREISMKNAVVIPQDYINTEINNNGQPSYYVWKISNNKFDKQYVEISDRLKYKDRAVIMYGLEEGDVIAGGR